MSSQERDEIQDMLEALGFDVQSNPPDAPKVEKLQGEYTITVTREEGKQLTRAWGLLCALLVSAPSVVSALFVTSAIKGGHESLEAVTEKMTTLSSEVFGK